MRRKNNRHTLSSYALVPSSLSLLFISVPAEYEMQLWPNKPLIHFDDSFHPRNGCSPRNAAVDSQPLRAV